jgi:hypothetical protein
LYDSFALVSAIGHSFSGVEDTLKIGLEIAKRCAMISGVSSPETSWTREYEASVPGLNSQVTTDGNFREKVTSNGTWYQNKRRKNK